MEYSQRHQIKIILVQEIYYKRNTNGYILREKNQERTTFLPTLLINKVVFFHILFVIAMYFSITLKFITNMLFFQYQLKN